MLNACSSGQADPVSGSNSIASDVVEQGVTFATSMRQDVPVTVASKFTQSFLSQLLADLSATAMPLRASHVAEIWNLQQIHQDPSDRALIAQATVEDVVLVSTDAAIGQYAGERLRVVQ